MSRPKIDLPKLRAKVRGLPHSAIYSMLDQAFDLLPPTKLETLISPYLSTDTLRKDKPDTERDSPKRLRVAVEEFAAASRRGDYYQTFSVNWKNCTEQSNGTIAWIAECNRLLDRCVTLAPRRRGVGDVVLSFELLFDLIEAVDAFKIDIIFFADEGGAYEIGVQWGTVMDAWFESFTRHTLKDGSYDRRVAAILERGDKFAGEAHQQMARAVRNRRPPPAIE